MSLESLKAKVGQLIEKAQSGDGLPDWDDDSPIIATGVSYNTSNVTWELTEKGTFRWKIVDTKGETTANLSHYSLASLPLDYQAIAPKIKQIYIQDGITDAQMFYAVNCERVRIPNTLNRYLGINYCVSLKELNYSSDLLPDLYDYICNGLNSLEKVVLKQRTTTLPARAFGGCYSLKEINLENITTFKSGCFFESFSLNMDIVFNSNLSSVEAQAFHRTRIKSVKFQNSTNNLPTIASNAFTECRELTDIYCSFAESAVANAPWGATNATIHYNYNAEV